MPTEHQALKTCRQAERVIPPGPPIMSLQTCSMTSRYSKKVADEVSPSSMTVLKTSLSAFMLLGGTPRPLTEKPLCVPPWAIKKATLLIAQGGTHNGFSVRGLG